MKRLITLFAAVVFAGQAIAQPWKQQPEAFDFEAKVGKVPVYYHITNGSEPYTVEIVAPSKHYLRDYINETKGDLAIPETIVNDRQHT